MDPDDDVEAALAVAWAKSSPHQDPERWLPLWQHLDDTADVAGFLWDDWVAPSVRATISTGLPGGLDDGRRLLTWLAGAHDVGKASPAFAVQVGALSNRMTRLGMRVGEFVVADRAKLRHEVAGAAALDRWLQTHGTLDIDQRAQLTTVLAAHHGGFHTRRAVREPRGHLLGGGRWDAVRDALLDRAAARAGILDRLDAWGAVRLPQVAVHLLTGVVIMADWIASDEETFPLLPLDDAPPPAPPIPGPSPRSLEAWRYVRLSDRWAPVAPDSDVASVFRDRFPGTGEGPRPIQAAVAELAATMPAPGLVVVEAPMGVGKTEAAFLAAETLASRTGSSGVAWALPTQATSNAMFSRMHAWTRRLPSPGGGRQSIALVHGKAALNDEYTDLRLRRLSRVYDEEPQARGARTRIDDRLDVAADEWTTGRKRAALSTFVVGTIDQVLFGALVARHLVLRQLAFAGKVVVIDEVHSADVYMSTFLDRALEWLGAAGAPVVLLSATLPAARRADLYIAYERGRRARSGLAGDRWVDAARTALDGDIGYPAVIATGAHLPAISVHPSPGPGSAVHVHRLDDDTDSLVALLTDRLRDGGCAVVVRDTVRRAQQTARDLAARLPDVDVTVGHAQYLAGTRAANDAALLRRFGPHGPGVDRPTRHVVVATQVVEQSLDVDFDLMVTDLAPVDLVLQRLGRLHRHRRADRPPAVREPHCYVTGVDWNTQVPTFSQGVAAVYEPWLLLRALSVLGAHLDGRPLTLPDDIAPLVQSAYASDTAAPTGWESALDGSWRAYAEHQATRVGIAQHFVLPEPGQLDGTLYGLQRLGVGAVDEDSPAAQGYVRDGGDSIEVVVVQRGADGTDRVPDWLPKRDGELSGRAGELLPFRHIELDRPQARALARCTLRLPASMTRQDAGARAVIAHLERDRFDGWQRTPLLTNQLALVLDDDGRATVAGFDLQYDEALGLLAERRAATPANRSSTKGLT